MRRDEPDLLRRMRELLRLRDRLRLSLCGVGLRLHELLLMVLVQLETGRELLLVRRLELRLLDDVRRLTSAQSPLASSAASLRRRILSRRRRADTHLLKVLLRQPTSTLDHGWTGDRVVEASRGFCRRALRR